MTPVAIRWSWISSVSLLLIALAGNVGALHGASADFENRLRGQTEYWCVPRGFAGSGKPPDAHRSLEKFSIDIINDDYCDCEDGSDEPGTAACANGAFVCQNVGGIQSKTIASSYVNDGYCDCCDGSDEWDSVVKCPDECVAQAQEQRKQAKEKANVIRAGLLKKGQMIADAKGTIEKAKTDVKELEKEQAELQRSAIWRKAQEATLVEHEKEVAKLPDEELPSPMTPEPDASPGVEPPLDDYDEPSIPMDLPPLSENLCLSLQSGNRFVGWITNIFKQFIGHPHIDQTNRLTNREKKEMARKCLEESRARRSAADSSLKSLERRLRDAKKKVDTKYGGEVALMASHGRCVKKKLGQYEFEHCMFEQVKQFEKGRMIASLGAFKSIDPATGAMAYTNGAKCYQGPERSATVFLECGLEEDILRVDEPEKCTYEIIFTTPAACSEAELANLEAIHDEL